jgi:hypothetical protein
MAEAMSASRVAYVGDGPDAPPSIDSGEAALKELSWAASGSGTFFCGSIVGDRAGLSTALGVANDELETLREWLGEGFRGT